MHLPSVTTPIQIRFTDLDQLGHVSNSIYPQYLDMGRIDLYHAIEAELKERDASEMQPINVVARLEIDFLSEIRLEHTVTVETWCEHIGKKSMRLCQEIHTDGNCAARATVVLVGMDPKTRQTMIYPQHWLPAKKSASKNQ